MAIERWSPVAQLKSAWRSKNVPATEVGWRQPYGQPGVGGTVNATIGAPGSPRRTHALSQIFGGTDTSDTWVYACTSLVMGTGASYEWSLVKQGQGKTARTPIASPPNDLVDLISFPNPQITYFDFAEDVFMDMELFGNSYWLMDRQNGLGQPAELYRLEPEYVQAVADRRDNLIGWVYTVGSVQVPYGLNEVIQFRTRNPLPRIGRFYGMGTVEALIREIESDLAQTVHVTSFFTNGARISGVLTSAEPMTPEQFRNVQLQFQDEYGGAGNAYKMLIADGATRYQAISQGPAALGIADLRKLSKDAILSGFNVPEFLLGGAAQAGVYKMEEAQNVFYRGMLPRAMRFEQKMERQLTSMWQVGFDIATGVTEPMSIKVARSREMVGTGASLNQILENQDLPKLSYPEADIPLLPGGITPWYEAAGMKPPAPILPPGGTNTDPTQNINQLEGESGTGKPNLTRENPINQAAEGIGDVETKAIKAPPLPDGYEKLTDLKAVRVSPAVMQAATEIQAEFLNTVTPQMRTSFVMFFSEQRKRIMERLSQFKGMNNRKAGKPTNELTIEELWAEAAEDGELTLMFLKLIDLWGPRAVALVSQITSPGIIWANEIPGVLDARRKMTELITRVNETTRDRIKTQILIGLRRRYSVQQIANGVPNEKYGGIVSVFDDAMAGRAELIARNEAAMLFSRAAIATYQAGGVGMVEVYDGVLYDEECASANGSIWTLAQADADPIQHPNCVRFFIPVSKGGKALES